MEVKDKLLEFIETSPQSSDVYFEIEGNLITICFTWKDKQENLWGIQIAYYPFDDDVELTVFGTIYELMPKKILNDFLLSDNMSCYLSTNSIQPCDPY